jgi:ribosomal protein S27E
MSKVRDHIHRLKKHKYKNGTPVFFCINNCSFKVEVPFALGMEVLCNTCGNPFTMTEYSLKLVKPHCNNCGKFRVVGEDGKAKFVPKGRATQALADLGKQAVSSMKDRMSKVVVMAKDEDI